MAAVAIQAVVKAVGMNGPISLGRQYPGRQVLVEEKEPGVWLVRTATVIPDNERHLHAGEAASDLEKALAWAQENPASDAETDALLEKLNAV